MVRAHRRPTACKVMRPLRLQIEPPQTRKSLEPRSAEKTSRSEPPLTREPSCKDEARVGQKNKITRRWAQKGTRRRAPHDQRTLWTYIFGAICPAEGKGAGLVLPWCDTDAMTLHLQAVSAKVEAGAHAVLIVDRAGWHLTPKLRVPGNISLIPLPPRAPELNPTENVWQFMRDNWLSNRVFKSHDDIVDHCCHAWNRLIDEPWRIMSIGSRDWANA